MIRMVSFIQCRFLIHRSCIIMSLKNKVVVITGASSGIGEAIALLFAKEGANLVIIGRNDSKLKVVAAQCAELGIEDHSRYKQRRPGCGNYQSDV